MEAVQMKVRVEKEEDLFDYSIRSYHHTVLRFLERRLNDRVRAEDLTQETFLKLFKQLKKRVPDNIPAWLYQVAGNLCCDYWRSAGYRKELGSIEQLPEQKDNKARVIDIYVRSETRTELMELMQCLPNSHREIIIMRFYKEMKLKEIADVLECPLGTVKSRLFHALRLLKLKLEGNGRVVYESYNFSSR